MSGLEPLPKKDEKQYIAEQLVNYLKRFEVDRVTNSFNVNMPLFITDQQIKAYVIGFLSAYYGRNVSIKQVCVNKCVNNRVNNPGNNCYCKEQICFSYLN